MGQENIEDKILQLQEKIEKLKGENACTNKVTETIEGLILNLYELRDSCSTNDLANTDKLFGQAEELTQALKGMKSLTNQEIIEAYIVENRSFLKSIWCRK